MKWKLLPINWLIANHFWLQSERVWKNGRIMFGHVCFCMRNNGFICCRIVIRKWTHERRPISHCSAGLVCINWSSGMLVYPSSFRIMRTNAILSTVSFSHLISIQCKELREDNWFERRKNATCFCDTFTMSNGKSNQFFHIAFATYAPYLLLQILSSDTMKPVCLDSAHLFCAFCFSFPILFSWKWNARAIH